MKQMAPRNRLRYAIAVAVVIIVGLLSRSPLAARLPAFMETYAGDTLWALALFLSLGLLFPNSPTAPVAIAALVIAYGIELSQLYQAPWIDRLRATDLGALVLGFGFLWTDLVCYACGIALGAAGEYTRGTLTRKKPQARKRIALR